eukprot:GHVU01173312.1.p2 GENE.GHVU01173312.1~~GHVU01173312.1.p2  ORF type:complete len:151 (+),score=19.24 GHVU01173312.1:535-987(+)
MQSFLNRTTLLRNRSEAFYPPVNAIQQEGVEEGAGAEGRQGNSGCGDGGGGEEEGQGGHSPVTSPSRASASSGATNRGAVRKRAFLASGSCRVSTGGHQHKNSEGRNVDHKNSEGSDADLVDTNETVYLVCGYPKSTLLMRTTARMIFPG